MHSVKPAKGMTTKELVVHLYRQMQLSEARCAILYMRCIEIFGGSEPGPAAGLIIMFLSIHYTKLKGFTFYFCMTLYLTIRPAVSILDRHDNRAASSVRPQHISMVVDHNHHMSCIVLQLEPRACECHCVRAMTFDTVCMTPVSLLQPIIGTMY